MRSTLTLVLSAALLSGCAVATVAGTAVGLVATTASVAVDATVGTAKMVGGALMPSSDKGK
ncbi:MAG TPA: hypothetical protein VMZ74_14490 [Ramlibacter sp.]|nr:hypothetical protein [Ramlibacter sp.]